MPSPTNVIYKNKKYKKYFDRFENDEVWASWLKKTVNRFHKNFIKELVFKEDYWYYEMKVVPGKNLLHFPQSQELANKVIDFSIWTVDFYYPFLHGDWCFNNIMLHNGKMRMIDFDTLKLSPDKGKNLNYMAKNWREREPDKWTHYLDHALVQRGL